METITKDLLAEEAVDALGSTGEERDRLVRMLRRQLHVNPAGGHPAAGAAQDRYMAQCAALDLLPDGWAVERYVDEVALNPHLRTVEYGYRDAEGLGVSVCRREVRRDGSQVVRSVGIYAARGDEAIAAGVALILAGLDAEVREGVAA